MHLTRPHVIPAALALALAVGAAAAPAQAADPLWDRTFMVEADARCALFEGPVRTALRAGAAQSRSAALRAGRSPMDVFKAQERARDRARRVSCAHPDLKIAAGRVRTAFAGWSRLARMDFPALGAPWRTDRFSLTDGGWSLSRSAPINDAVITVGRLAADGPPVVVVSFVGRARPIAARLVMRDAARFAQPWIAARPSLAPEPQRRAWWAGAVAPAPRELLVKGRRRGEIWTFPAAALRDLTLLDPREAFAVEFVFRDGTVARAIMDVGDLSAAEAFLAMGPL